MALETVRLHGAPGWEAALYSPFPEESGIYRLHLEAKESLRTATLLESVRLPVGIGRSEWIAAQTFSVWDEARMVVLMLSNGVCTELSCPVMCAGHRVTYEWTDEAAPEAEAEARRLTARDYMLRLVIFGHGLLRNRSLVPQDGSPFPESFLPEMRRLHRRLFRVYAHAYLHHFAVIREHSAEAHLNCCFKHWLFFVREFQLVEDKDMVPLKELIAKFEQHYVPERCEVLTNMPWLADAAVDTAVQSVVPPPLP